jgi:WD40 repeat protein
VGRVRLWDFKARRVLHELLIPERAVPERWPYAVAFSPDGGTLAIAGRVLRLYRVDSRRPIGGPLGGHEDAVTSVAFSPDGRTLATGSDDRTVRLWDVRTRRALGQPLTGHTDAVNDVAFSPDGRTLASAGNDRTIGLWDVHARRALGRPLRGHTSFLYSVAFSPDGRSLASTGDDRTIRLWDAILWSDDQRALERRICGIVKRSLTRPEWAEFVPDRPYRRTCPQWP